MVANPAIAPIPSETAGNIKDEILDTLRKRDFSGRVEKDVLDALSGSARVLPEGKPSPCSAMVCLCYASAANKESDQVVPAAAAMEMLMAAGDLIDDIQDDEVPLPRDRHAVGRALSTVSLLLMLAHHEIRSLVDRGVPASRVLRGLAAFDRLGLDALKG